ncbi:MAG: glycosyltransferase family 87 protein [Vicinamibacterales bacterium]
MTDDGARAALRQRLWPTLALLACALLLAWVAGFYHPGTGFSSLLIIPAPHESEIPAFRAVPHFEYPPHVAYDGYMYAQLAMDPLLRDPAIDGALDDPPYRARRILFAWTAWALGFGRPAWIMQAYALQNVLSWLLLGWVMTRWFPLDRPSHLALWIGCMFSQGLLMSIRMSLLDGPSVLLIACAAAAAERGRVWLTAMVLSIAALGRETNLLALLAFPRPRDWRSRLRLASAIVIAILPLLLWQDYIWSIYRGSSLSAGSDHVVVPFVSYLDKWRATIAAIGVHGMISPAGITLPVLVALTVQAVFIAAVRDVAQPWWRIAAAWATLMFIVDPSVWDGYPGAITRITLPMKLGFNVLLARRHPRHFWVWLCAGNLDLIASLHQ